MRKPAPSRRSLRGLDWFNFFIGDVQTGFGPFVAVHLTAQAWTQAEIGLVLTAGSLVALVGQIPGGAIVDAARSKRRVAAVAVTLIALSALTLALWPIFPAVLAAQVLHGAASCMITPAVAAISLGLVGHAAIAERLGRNARFASFGNGIAAAVMGICGYLISPEAVFFITAASVVPALLAITHVKPAEIDPSRARGAASDPDDERNARPSLLDLARNRPLLIFAGCVLLFHLANAGMLPLIAGLVTMRSSDWAPAFIGAGIVVPQLVVAAISPWVGQQAEHRGRRPLLLLGFAAQAIRGLLFVVLTDPAFFVIIQILDGVSAAAFGVMVPLVVADVTRKTGHYSLALGVVGTAAGIGASFSTTLAGTMADAFGGHAAFLALAGIVVAGFGLVWMFMPETRPDD